MSTTTELPWVCPDHPVAQVLHTWDRTRTETHWAPHRARHLVSEVDHNHRYECSECGIELAPPPEAP